MRKAACSGSGCGGFCEAKDRLHESLRAPERGQVLGLLIPSEQGARPALRARRHADEALAAPAFRDRISEHCCSYRVMARPDGGPSYRVRHDEPGVNRVLSLG